MGRWRHKTSKTRFGCKTFYFARKSPWGISEPPGAFGIEQAQKNYRQIEASHMALRALHCFGNARPTMPYIGTGKVSPKTGVGLQGHDLQIIIAVCP
jgi:hypothetical protein